MGLYDRAYINICENIFFCQFQHHHLLKKVVCLPVVGGGGDRAWLEKEGAQYHSRGIPPSFNIEKETDGQAQKETDRQNERQMDKQTDRQTEGQKDKWTNRQREKSGIGSLVNTQKLYKNTTFSFFFSFLLLFTIILFFSFLFFKIAM